MGARGGPDDPPADQAAYACRGRQPRIEPSRPQQRGPGLDRGADGTGYLVLPLQTVDQGGPGRYSDSMAPGLLLLGGPGQPPTDAQLHASDRCQHDREWVSAS